MAVMIRTLMIVMKPAEKMKRWRDSTGFVSPLQEGGFDRFAQRRKWRNERDAEDVEHPAKRAKTV